MATLILILRILFVLVSLLLIFIVAIQSEDNAGLGGVFGGSGDTAFGGQTNKVINKITAWIVVAFFVLAVVIGILSKTPGVSAPAVSSTVTSVVETVSAN